MKCVKTGLYFQTIYDNINTYHADMYYSNTIRVIVIRGIAMEPSASKPDIIVKEYGDCWVLDKINSMSFDEWWHEQNPKIDITDLFIIIADSRF